MKNFNFSLAVFIVVLLLVSCSESKKIEIVDNNDSSNQSGEKNDSDDSDSTTDTTQDNGDSQHEGTDSSDSVDDSSDTVPDNSEPSDPSDDTDSSDPNDSDTTDSTTEKDSCENNPCERIPNSTGVCIPKGTSNYTCKCKENYTWNGSLCAADSKVASCTGLPENAQWNSVSTITQTWNGSDWVPSSTGTFNEITSTIDCRYKCNEHYTWKNSSCAADNRTANCTGLPDNAIWNSVPDITQTWNGFEWSPSTTGTYNDEASSEYCRYKCKEHYTWTNSICKADQQVKNCTEIPANAEWNTVSTITQTWNGTSWAPSTNTTYNESGSTSECRFKCAENYTYENSQCVGAKRTKPCDGLPKNAVWNTAESIEQTWDGYDWTPSNIGVYNTTSSTNVCRYKCNEYCKWEESRCVCPCDIEPCASVENSTGHCTATDWDEYSCECEPGYFWKNSECKKVTLGNICTGQNQCYDASIPSTRMLCPVNGTDFFGQDPQYAAQGTCIQKFTLDILDNDVVFDLNTGLMWQAKKNEYTWNNAVSYCNNTYAGYSDWRLPTPKELLTIPNVGNSYSFWSSSSFVNDTTQAWSLQEGGAVLEVNKKSYRKPVRCVRGTVLPENSFTTVSVDNDVIVTDTETGLIWQKTYVSGKPTWKEDLAYCENLIYAGYSDWRLPNKNELASLVNYEKFNPASDFPDMPSDWFRSSSNNRYVNFANGVVSYKTTGVIENILNYYVRCVRSDSEKLLQICNGNPCETIPDSTPVSSHGISGTIYSCNYGEDNWTGPKCMHMLPECSKTSETPCYDSKTVLVWSQKSDNTMTYSEARSYCQNYSEGGLSGWRLPNIDELRTLLIASRVSSKCGVSAITNCLSSSCWGCLSCTQTGTQDLNGICDSYGSSYIDGRYGKFGETGFFWSSSNRSNGTGFVWGVNFNNGSVLSDDQSNTNSVRCVRN